MASTVTKQGSTLEELAFWRKAFLIQLRRWPKLTNNHRYLQARKELAKHPRLPA